MFATRVFAPRPLSGLVLAVLLSFASATAQAQTIKNPGKAPKGTMIYVVQDSDSLGKLGSQLLKSPKAWQQVAEINQLPDANKIFPGQKLIIPLHLLRPSEPGVEIISVVGDVKSGVKPLKAGDKLAEGANIEAGSKSSATLKMADGSRVTVASESLAQVIESRRFGGGESGKSATTTWYSGVMRLVQGGLDIIAAKEVARTSPFRVQAATATIGVRGTQFRVSLNNPENGIARTEVTEGKVRADNNQFGTGADLTEGYGALVDPRKREVQTAKLLGAPDLSGSPEIVQPVEGTVAWGFGAVDGAKHYRTQVAKDADFAQILEDQKTSEPFVLLSLSETGPMHVRVRAIDALGLEGMQNSRVVEFLPERILLPAFFLIGGRSWFEFKLPRPQEGKYKATIATDRGFAQVVQQDVLVRNEWEIKNLQGGKTYYFKLESVDPKEGVDQRYLLEMPDKWGSELKDSVALLEPIK